MVKYISLSRKNPSYNCYERTISTFDSCLLYYIQFSEPLPEMFSTLKFDFQQVLKSIFNQIEHTRF